MIDRTEELQAWWDWIDESERRHARACIDAGHGDARLTRSLQWAGIVLVILGSDTSPAVMTHIPRDVQAFVDAQPH